MNKASWRKLIDMSEARVPLRVRLGTSGDDRLRGGRNGDVFDMSQGGDDRVQARGGDDAVHFGGAFTAADRVNGGEGYDIVTLRGDYSAGVGVEKHSLIGIERLVLEDGPYVITGMLGFVDADGQTHVDANASQRLDINASSVGDLVARGGWGDDVIHGSANGVISYLDGAGGDDTLIGGSGPNSLAGREGQDLLIGGSGRTLFWGGDGADRIEMKTFEDVLDYLGTSESVSSGYDVIESFQGRIRLFFDSDTTVDGVQYDFHLGRTDDHVGDIISRYDASVAETIVRVFSDADAKPDLILHLTGRIELTTADFIFGCGCG